MIYGEEIKKLKLENNNDTILEALEFIEEDYSQLLETKNNEILNEIHLTEKYEEVTNAVKQFDKDMTNYRKEYKKAIKEKDKNKINSAIKGMRSSIKHARYIISNSDTELKELLFRYNYSFLINLKLMIPTFIYAAAVYGVNINSSNKLGIVKTACNYINRAIFPAIKSTKKLIELIPIESFKSLNIIEENKNKETQPYFTKCCSIF